MNIALYSLFVLSVVFLPWWVSVLLGVFISLTPIGSILAVLGGAVMDLTFGAPLGALFGIHDFYTLFFLCLAVVMFVLRQRVLD